jgi:hypothetical protein
MNVIIAVVLATIASSFWAASAGAEEKLLSTAQNNAFEFTHFLRYQPLDLEQLLGKHFSEVVPGFTWDSLPIAEEYKNPMIRYDVFARGEDLHNFMKDWDFMTDNYCISKVSGFFLLFFNRGFVFKVELRYVPDSYYASIKPDDPAFCADETPIFKMIAKKLGGTVIVTERAYVGTYEVRRSTSKYVMTLATGEGGTDLTWDLRGGPSSPNF